MVWDATEIAGLQVLDRAVVRLNNLSVRGRGTRARASEILMLMPSCLQAAGCGQNVVSNLAVCKRCGRCKIGPLLELADRYEIERAIAKGGRVAVELARQSHIRAIIAVACERELRSGIMACLPKAVVAVANERPNGPCCETDVDLAEVEKAIRWLTRGRRPGG